MNRRLSLTALLFLVVASLPAEAKVVPNTVCPIEATNQVIATVRIMCRLRGFDDNDCDNQLGGMQCWVISNGAQVPGAMSWVSIKRCQRDTGWVLALERHFTRAEYVNIAVRGVLLNTFWGGYAELTGDCLLPEVAEGEYKKFTVYLSGHLDRDLEVDPVSSLFVPAIDCVDECNVCRYRPCPAGVGEAKVGSVNYRVSLGWGSFGRSAGQLEIRSASPAASLAHPLGLSLTAGDGIEIVTNEQGALRQVLSPQALADIVPISDQQYEIRFYHTATLEPPAGDLYQPTDPPYSVINIADPDLGTNFWQRLRITESHEGAVRQHDYQYDPDADQWSLVTGAGTVHETRAETWNPDGTERTDTQEVRNDQGDLVRVTRETWHAYAWGTNLVERITGADADAQTNRWTYYDDVPPANGSYGRLQSKSEASGYWERYEYDANRRLTKIVAPFLDLAETAPDDQCRVTTIGYADAPPHVTRVVTLDGQEIERQYRVTSDAETREIQCVTPGAAWDDPDNLVTVTRRHTSLPFRTELAAVIRPDGTATRYEYALAADGRSRTTTVSTGALNADGTAITNGTRTATTVNRAGETLQETVHDIATALLLSSTSAISTDLFGRVTASVSPTGTNTVNYNCCGIGETIDEEGIATTQEYDALGRVTATIRNGITATQTYDAAGRITAVTQTGRNGQSLDQQQLSYNTAGQLIQQQTGPQPPTVLQETRAAAGGIIRTTTLPDGETRIETYHRDGRLERLTGTAVHGRRYAYGVATPPGETIPRYYVHAILLRANDADSDEYTITYHDLLGRPYLVRYPDGAVARRVFNTRGQLERETDPDGGTRLYAYDDQGQLEYAVLDINQNHQIDLAGPDRVVRTRRSVLEAHGTTVRRATTSVWSTTDIDAETVILAEDVSADGRQSWFIRQAQTNQTAAVIDPDLHRQTLTTTRADGIQQVDLFENGLLTATTVHDAAAVLRESRRYHYDAHDRLVAIEDQLSGTVSSNQYDQSGQLVLLVRSAPGLESQTRSLAYDASGRVISTALPGGGVLEYEYHPTGELQRSTGTGTYPVAYTYDYAGRVQTMTTWQTASTGTGEAVTTWEYDPQRGFLTAKRFPDNRGPSYAYTATGRRQRRISARNIITSNLFNTAGEIIAVHHSDDTLATTYQYDRRGRVTLATAGTQSTAYLYNDTDRLLRENQVAGPLTGLQLDLAYDALDRRTNLTVTSPSFTLDPVATQYTPASRFQSVGTGSHRAQYEYDPSGARIATITVDQAGTPRLTAARTYDTFSRLTNLTYSSHSSYPSYSYSYDSADRRAQVTWADGSAWHHTYDVLGRLTAASRRWPDDAPVAGQQFAWSYDDIGNRISSTITHPPSTIEPNLLNQTAARTVPGFADVIGTATSNTTVTVNDQPTTRQSDYFHAAVPTTNTTTAAYPVLHVLGVQNYAGPDDEDAIAEHTGRAFVPQTPEAFVFDEEGNLTQDGRWIYSWDAFNRLIRQETRADLPAEVPRRRLEFAYDHQGRRTRKLVSAWQQDQWTPTADLRYVYDGWTLLAELDALATPEAPTLLRSYLWGPDLSSTMRGAGGAGGLVAVTLHQPTPKTHYAIADAGGNVTALVAADTGELSAVYEYAPYGALLRATGPAASLNPIRHASKLADLETGLAYYGHRYYSPDLGRWLSRDPLAENGGVNLYAFLGNDPVNYTDPLGLAGFFFDGTYNYTDAAGVSAANQQRPTNVWKMWRAYDEASKWYYGGIGNEVEFGSGLTHWLGGAGGRGGQGILDRAFERVTQTYNRWDKKIDIFGFSRGAALALEFSNMIADGIVVTDENGEEVKITTRSGSRFTMKWCDVRIRFVGLYDVVGSFGLPGNHINPGYRLYLPTKIPVTKAVHAIALDEYRSFFPVTNIRGALQVGFRGAHSDIGGSYAEEGLSNITLRWMIQHARSVGVRFRSTYDQAPVNHFQPPHNSAGEGSPTGLRGFPPDMIIHDSAFGSSLLTGWIQ